MPYLTKPVPNPEPVDCRILTAALDLFVARGFHSVSVHDVQKMASVSIGSIYNHFGGKEGIAKALYDHLLIEIEQMIEQVCLEHANSKQRCDRVIELLFQYTETKRSIISYVFHLRHSEVLPQEPSIYHSKAFTMLQELIDQVIIDEPGITSNRLVVNASIFGGAIRMIQMRLEGVIDVPLNQYYDEAIVLIWNGLAHENS
ncbi:MAG: AcrR family transcriptional regulator [Oceanospirillaceae bacterium]|jgi:AcrR family transcriptional regulator